MGFSESDLPRLDGRVFVVTGGNSGIGWEASRMFASRGAHVVLACRNAKKAEGALEAIRAVAKDAKVEAMALDLADLASVRAFAERLRAAHPKLDVLVNNAGLMAIPQAKTADGFEMQLGTNHLGHFALTGLLLPALEAAGEARVVSVASAAHRIGRMHWDDLMFERRYDRWAVYGQSKLANLLFTKELSRRLAAKGSPIRALACHPGYAATALQTKGAELGGSQAEGFLMRIGNGVLAQSAARGALPTARAAVDPDARSDDYFGPSGLLELAGSPVKVGRTARASDPEAARKLWEASERLTGVRYLD